jgi:transcriptional regulator with XRE-family HTH domain
MELRIWRQQQNLTMAICGQRIGLRDGRSFQRYETGENQPDADMVARIIFVTDGAVTAADMYATRLAWLLANRPDKFDGLAAASGCLAGDRSKPDDASTPDPMTAACFPALAKRGAELDPDPPPDG